MKPVGDGAKRVTVMGGSPVRIAASHSVAELSMTGVASAAGAAMLALTEATMKDILTLTLNPALDHATSVPRIEPDKKLRCGPETAEPGGGGVNVARAVTQLGGHARPMVALRGPNGDALEALLRDRALCPVRIEGPGDTRQSFAVTEDATGVQYRFVLPGPRWTEDDLSSALGRLAAEAAPDGIVVLSGSMPPGADTRFCTRACAALGAGRYTVVDTSGPQLETLAKGPQPAPAVLRMDSHEAQALSGQSLDTRAESAAFAATLRDRGAGRVVIIARGVDGSVMADADGLWSVNAANDTVRSAIGAGDSFVGGFCLGVARGEIAAEALRMGAAAAAAAVLSPGTELCRPDDYAHFLARTTLERL